MQARNAPACIKSNATLEAAAVWPHSDTHVHDIGRNSVTTRRRVLAALAIAARNTRQRGAQQQPHASFSEHCSCPLPSNWRQRPQQARRYIRHSHTDMLLTQCDLSRELYAHHAAADDEHIACGSELS